MKQNNTLRWVLSAVLLLLISAALTCMENGSENNTSDEEGCVSYPAWGCIYLEYVLFKLTIWDT